MGWLTDVGRELANAQGWYERRRVVQIVVLSILAGIGIGLAVVIARVRGILRAHRLAFLGMVFLVGFVLMRASSFFRNLATLADKRGRLSLPPTAMVTLALARLRA